MVDELLAGLSPGERARTRSFSSSELMRLLNSLIASSCCTKAASSPHEISGSLSVREAYFGETAA